LLWSISEKPSKQKPLTFIKGVWPSDPVIYGYTVWKWACDIGQDRIIGSLRIFARHEIMERGITFGDHELAKVIERGAILFRDDSQFFKSEILNRK
jgi:hypothetical protein